MTGRVQVKRGHRAITLVLAQWAHGRDAVLADEEARELVRLIQEALTQPTLPDIL